MAASPHLITAPSELLWWEKCPWKAGNGETQGEVNIHQKNGNISLKFQHFCPFPQHIFKFKNFVDIGTDWTTPLIRSFELGLKLGGWWVERLFSLKNETDAIHTAGCHSCLKLAECQLRCHEGSYHKTSWVSIRHISLVRLWKRTNSREVPEPLDEEDICALCLLLDSC